MASRWTSYTLALAVLGAPMAGGAAGTSAAAEKAPQVDEASPPPADGVLPGQDLDHPPRGTPEDQALWRSGHEVTNQVHIERARATRLQTLLVKLKYTERLKLLEAKGGDAAKRSAALQKGLSDAHASQFTVLTARWPVDTYRVCSYPAMEFGSMSAGNPEPSELAKHRAMLVGCVEQAEASVKLLKQGNDGLAAAMKAADEALKAAGVGIPGLAPASAAADKAAPRPQGR
jgi:hypothetical protein